MKRMTMILTVMAVASATGLAATGEIGFVEEFSLAKDRAEVLKRLIPGTHEYYYYTCLYHQNRGELDQVDKTLAAWVKRYHTRTSLVREIEDRQALLRYDKDPAKALAHITHRLNLRFNHQRETLGRKSALPTSLNPNIISRETLTKRAFALHSRTVSGFEDAALDWVIKMNLSADRRRHLLSRLARPDHANLPKLVVDDLNYKYSRHFGSHKIHAQLLTPQLEACLKLKADLLNQSNFVNTYLTKLRPGWDVDLKHDTKAREAYLDRLWAFVSRLAPVHNSLKAHVLYQRLVHDRALGTYDKDRFMAYVALPRSAVYARHDYIHAKSRRQYWVNLRANYSRYTVLPPTGNDEPLIRSYLMHFFATEDSYKPYMTYLKDTYLRAVFAETKAVLGLGDAEQWYSTHPGDFKALTERVDLDFAYTNKTLFGVDEPVKLGLNVKNVKTLLVKVFEINAMNYYRENGREVDTDITLDGLVANSEKVVKYAEPPIRRVARTFTFPELNTRGTYVIEFIGNGRSSRALVRKGKLRFLSRTSTAGHVFTILDEANRPVRDATLHMAGHEYKADADDGTIAVPFSTRPGTQQIILAAGSLACLDRFAHQSESYQLQAGIYVDREALLNRATARVVVRPALALNGEQVTLSVLEEPTLVITSVDHDGVATTKDVPDFTLHEDAESTYEFQVPRRLSRISFVLKAKVQNMSLNKKQDLSASATFALNQIDRTEKVEDLHLMHVKGAYVLELLGKTGEARADRPVQFTIKHRDFRDLVHVSLQTDKNGRIALGALADIDRITAKGPEGTGHTWHLPTDRHSYPASVHGRAGQAISLPYMGALAKADRSELSLLELRGSTFEADRFAALSIRDGFVTVSDLPAGDYDLLIKPSATRIRIRLTAGRTRGEYALSATRHLEVRNPTPLQIASVTADAKAVTVRLKNATKFVRVHVFATRYLPEYSAYGNLDRLGYSEPTAITLAQAESRYIAGRNIGDEYRYILDRKHATIFPGNMLKRPELLLNPWAIRKTDAGKQVALTGEGYGRTGTGGGGRRFGGKSKAKPAPAAGNFANLDFLSEATAVLLNLRADKDGVVTIDRKDLGAHHQIHVVAVDPENAVYREIALDEQKMAFKDLFLIAGLDPKGHFAEKKQISVVPAGETFKLTDIATARFQEYDSLARVYGLQVTLSGSSTLVEFGFILGWPKMTDAQKREKYSKYACHELNYFLYKKDRKFFDAVVLPYMRNKKDKTFMDHVLLGDDLRGYLEPWRYARLNIVERILLAQRIQGEDAHTGRHVKELYDLIPPNIERFNHLFRTALKGSSLDTGDRFGFDEAAEKRNLERIVNYQKRLGRAPGEGKGDGAGVAAGPRPATKTPTPKPAPPGRSRRESNKDRADKLAELKEESEAAADEDKSLDSRVAGKRGKYFAEDKKKRTASRRFYQKLDKTKEWVENNYYHLPIESQNASLITVNAFWKDYAAHGRKKGKFFSRNLAEATRNFPEMMFALSVLDLPFVPGKHEPKADGETFSLKAGSGMVIFHKEIKPADPAGEKTPILVSQNFFRHNDRYRHVNNERFDKYVTEEFLVHVVYGCQVVITNPTSSRQKLDVLLQIPRGAMPVLNGRATRSVHIQLQPFSTQRMDYYFYFPAKGRYRHYPVHVSKNEKLIAFAPPFVLNVVETLTKVDKTSWDYISQHGTPEQVVEFLNTHNLGRIDLGRIAWRMKDAAYFRKVIDLLTTRHAYHQTLWSYGLKHNVLVAAREFLKHSSYANGCGMYIDTKLLTIDPVERRTYQHMEYSPLVNARRHQLGRRRKIVNHRFYAQYMRLMKVLTYREKLDDTDLMAVTYYMLLQDRVAEALAFFERVDPKKLPTQIQHDYFTAYIAFYRADVKAARAIATKYAEYPVDRWRNVYAAVLAQADEIDGKAAKVIDPEDRAQVQARLAATAPSFELTVADKKIKLTHQNLDTCRINYYLMDIELLFSRQPFVGKFSGQFSYIKPNQSDVVKLKRGEGPQTLTIDLPKRFGTANVMIEIVAGGVTKSQAYYSNALAVQVIENYGQVRVTQADGAKAVAKAYVKVYARGTDGRVKFYKDGYTDLRGRFDYTSLNTNEIDRVSRLAILILSPVHGAVVREAAPPKR